MLIIIEIFEVDAQGSGVFFLDCILGTSGWKVRRLRGAATLKRFTRK